MNSPQQVNLYRHFKALEPTSVLLPWNKFLLFDFIFIVMLAINSSYSLRQLHRLQITRDNLVSARRKLELQVSQIKQSYPDLFFEKDAQQTINKMQEKLSAQEKMLAQLLNKKIFSDIFTALAETTTPDVWLTQFSIENAGSLINLKGKAIKLINIEPFITKLTLTNAFAEFTLGINNIVNETSDAKSPYAAFDISLVKK